MYYENRLIAMLDVLGMANQLKDKSSLLSSTEKYSQLIQEAQKSVISQMTMQGSQETQKQNFEIAEFVFDTIVLVSKPIDIGSTAEFITGTISLMELFFKEQMPLRGSIGQGDYVVNEDTNIFLSNVFKRLNNDELNQEWAGCCIDPLIVESVLHNISGVTSIDKDNQIKSMVLHLMDVPMKDNVVDERVCLNWSYFLNKDELSNGLEYMLPNKKKYANTKKYLDDLNAFQDDSQRVENMAPVTKIKTMKTRSGFRMMLTDDNDIPVNPGGM